MLRGLSQHAYQVRARLEMAKARKAIKPKAPRELSEYKKRLQERTAAMEEEERQRRRAKRRRKKGNSGDEAESGSGAAPASDNGQGAEAGAEAGAEEGDLGGMDPAMAAMMGFSGFGGSKKR